MSRAEPTVNTAYYTTKRYDNIPALPHISTWTTRAAVTPAKAKSGFYGTYRDALTEAIKNSALRAAICNDLYDSFDFLIRMSIPDASIGIVRAIVANPDNYRIGVSSRFPGVHVLVGRDAPAIYVNCDDSNVFKDRSNRDLYDLMHRFVDKDLIKAAADEYEESMKYFSSRVTSVACGLAVGRLPSDVKTGRDLINAWCFMEEAK